MHNAWQIAEGGYSFVYLAQEVVTLGTGEDSTQYAIKKVPLFPVALRWVARQLTWSCLPAASPSSVAKTPCLHAQILAGTSEQLEQARAEVRVLQRLRHPNLLPLLAADTRELQDDEESGVTAFYLLFPLYTVRMPLPVAPGHCPCVGSPHGLW